MSESNIGALFGEAGNATRPRIGRIVVVLIFGMTLTILGMACTAVPGGMVTLVAWALAERELGRVDSGYLPIETRPSLVALRVTVLICLAIVLVLFIIQGLLLCGGYYFALWTWAIELLRPMAMEPLPPT